MALRQIIRIDEDKCDGCGLCVPACKEGAIRIIDGKARLVAERLCDGLGACLGECPRGAITIEERQAEEFDERAVAEHLAAMNPIREGAPRHGSPQPAVGSPHGSCPGARFARLEHVPQSLPGPQTADAPGEASWSELSHWPVQLRLLPASAPVLQGAHLLVAADCVPVAYADFHRRMLRGRAVVIACPKLDDPQGYIEKLAAILGSARPASVTVAHMEVPCCTGILRMVLEARRLSGSGVPVRDVTVGTQGAIVNERTIPAEVGAAAAGCGG